jgi:N-acetylglucosaminyl-diphospho-decaprenol L-rhamnosyltransferase
MTNAMKATASVCPDIAIVIVNYNTSALLRDCLRSIFDSELDLARLPSGEQPRASRPLSVDVCVVDNDSRDDSVAMVGREFPGARVIANSGNVGYPAANNQGLRLYGFGAGGKQDRGLPRYALLLNPDTQLPPDALAAMVAFMERTPRAGVVGPRLVRLDGSLDKACRRSFPTPEVSLYHMLYLDRFFPKSRRFARYNLSYQDEREVAKVDAIVGAFMLVRREAIEQVGLLDETFFMYGEDLDWAKRITEAGWDVWYYPKVTVLHVKEAASRTSLKARREFYRAMNIFYNKHYRAHTPFWLDWLIRGGVAVVGALDLAARRLRGQYSRSAS